MPFLKIIINISQTATPCKLVIISYLNSVLRACGFCPGVSARVSMWCKREHRQRGLKRVVCFGTAVAYREATSSQNFGSLPLSLWEFQRTDRGSEGRHISSLPPTTVTEMKWKVWPHARERTTLFFAYRKEKISALEFLALFCLRQHNCTVPSPPLQLLEWRQ